VGKRNTKKAKAPKARKKEPKVPTLSRNKGESSGVAGGAFGKGALLDGIMMDGGDFDDDSSEEDETLNDIDTTSAVEAERIRMLPFKIKVTFVI
jgi:hypothetical protein